MTRLDLEMALWGLGSYIDRTERTSPNFPDLIKMKHAYLRIHHYLIKTAKNSHQEVLLTKSVLRNLPDDIQGFPRFLPCNKSQSRHHFIPCIENDDVCHCAQLLQCNLEEEDETGREMPYFRSGLLQT